MKIQKINRLLAAFVVVALAALAFPFLPVSAEEGLPKEVLEPTEVVAISAEDFQWVLEANQGKVVLVNFWATWCIPCVQELPELNELQKRFGDKGLKVIAVSLDEVDHLEKRVQPFFEKNAPDLISYLSTEEEPFDFVGTLDQDWFGALPSSYIYGRDGKLAKGIAGRVSYQRFEELVTAQLAVGVP